MSYIVMTYNEFSRDSDHEFESLHEAVEFLGQAEQNAAEMQTATPVLSHPSGDGREWSLEHNNWI